MPSERFQHVHIDISVPLPPVGPYRYCLTAIDRYTRWPKVLPLERITAEDVTSAFFAGWISSFGMPRHVTTDQGRQFESQLFRLLGLSTGFQRSRTTSDQPCANGMIERFRRQLKAAITCHPNSTWLEALPAVALGLRATFKPDIQATPAEHVYGEQASPILGNFSPLQLPTSPPRTLQTLSPGCAAQCPHCARLQQHVTSSRPRSCSRTWQRARMHVAATTLYVRRLNDLTPDPIKSSAVKTEHSPFKSAGGTFVSSSTD
ncbi:uncharacterized protein LOC119444304 [Dermacentor silvarum]|uniref:uncharacterized protein LOC119444304 n=1 Tax=Dermacentor silvarum TaxID=543639 RepID=UPI001899386B|nr:uncharacterized protein LOC119444304 [Dermacentor silvarum]